MWRANHVARRTSLCVIVGIVVLGIMGLTAFIPAVHAQDRAEGRTNTTGAQSTGSESSDSAPVRTDRSSRDGPSPLPEDSRSLDPPSTGSDLGKMLLETLLVLAAVCLLAYVVLRWGVSRLVGAEGAGEGPIEVLARQPVGPDASILVVQIGSKTLIVGSGESGMTRLGELEPDEAEALVDAAPDEETGESWISTWLQRQGETT